MNVPILSSKFFEKYAPDLGFFTKWRSIYPWNDQIMPIYEWQDILYVGCANIPATLPKSQQKIIFLLCDPEELKRVWYNFEGTVVVSSAQTSSPAGTASLKPHIPEPAFHSPPVLKFDIEETQTPQSLNPLIAEDSQQSEALDFSKNKSVDKIDLSTGAAPDSAKVSDDHESQELTLSFENLDPIDLQTTSAVQEIVSPSPEEKRPASLPTKKTTTELEVIMEVKLDQMLNPQTSTPTALVTKVTPSASPQPVIADPMDALMAQHGGGSLENLEVNFESADSDTPKEEKSSEEEDLELLDLGGPAPAPTLQTTAPTASAEDSIILEPLVPPTSAEKTKPITTAQAPVKESTLTASVATAEKTNTTKSQLKSPPLEAWAEKVISEIKLEFDKVMILLRTGDQVKPWRWDEDFKSSTLALTPFSLIPPSPFRIVNRTHKSYHGYVVTNDFNQKFFAQWNDNEVPEHMTISPIINQDVVVGMVLAMGKKTADTKGCLQLIEDKAATLASHITATPSAA